MYKNVATEISVLVAHWLPLTILFRYACLEILEWQGSPMPMGYEQFKPPQNNLNAPNSGRIKIESEDFLIYDVPGDGQCFFHVLSLAITGNLSQSLVYRSFEKFTTT
jgi:hypothetical protein